MGKVSKRPGARSPMRVTRPMGAPAKTPAKKPGKKPGKKPTNLTLDPEAVTRGERFGRRHGTSLSQLVTGFLYSLPADEDTLPQLTPPVRRLYGLAAGGTTDRDAYRHHLVEKYGRR